MVRNLDNFYTFGDMRLDNTLSDIGIIDIDYTIDRRRNRMFLVDSKKRKYADCHERYLHVLSKIII